MKFTRISFPSREAAILSQQTDQSPAAPIESAEGSAEKRLETIAPYRINPETGELLLPDGKFVPEAERNSDEKKQSRPVSLFAIQQPEEFWKTTPFEFPPKEPVRNKGRKFALRFWPGTRRE